MICSITSRGLEMPPDQKESQRLSIFDFNAPVMIRVSSVHLMRHGAKRWVSRLFTP